MPYTKAILHYVWSTKNRAPLITPELKPLLLDHIKENSKLKGIFIDFMNCVKDHIHLLISLGNEQTISKTAMLIKGESSFWINRQKLTNYKFEWQEEYFALSVNFRNLDDIRASKADQENHHRKITFEEEYNEFIKNYNFDLK